MNMNQGCTTEEEPPMDTKEVAQRLGTTPKDLRRFLRTKSSTYEAVGSDKRYAFRETDIPELTKRFRKWADGRAAKAAEIDADAPSTGDAKRPKGDEAVWAEEESRRGSAAWGDLPDIRDPRVRAEVKRRAAEQEARLNELLIARGVHVSQGWVSSAGATR